MKTPNVKCIACKKEVYMPKYRIKTFKYCSRACKDKFGCAERIIAKCAICNTVFDHISSRCNKAKYCSRKCFHKSQINRGSKEFHCIRCNKKFFDSPSRARKYCCRNCAFELRKWAKIPSFTTIRRYMIRNNLIVACHRCGYDAVPEILGIHHIDKNRLNNSIDNIQILCPTCHSLMHKKHICH